MISKRDGKNYFSGTAQYWIENIDLGTCNRNEFVFADIFCYNASAFIENYVDDWLWFPITYVYNQREYENNLFRQFSVRLQSKEQMERIIGIFGYKSKEEFIKKYSEMEDQMKKGVVQEYRYSNCFESAPLICKIISSQEIGTRN